MRQRWPVLVLGAAVAVSALLILHLGRGQTLVVDQWGYLFAYRSWAPHSLLFPHNGHLIVLPLLVYKAMYATFGIGSQLPYQLVNIAFYSSVAILLFALIRDRVGDLVAVGAAVLLLFYGAGADVIVPTYQYPNLIGLASGLGMLLALRRADRRGDLAACVLLGMSLASFTLGVAFAVGAAVILAFRPRGRRLRSCWVVFVPLAAYAAWALWARQFGQETLYVHNLKILGSALADQLGAVLSGLTGLFTTPNGPSGRGTVPIRTDWESALVVGLAALLIARLRRPPRPTPEAIASVAVLVSYFLLVGIALNMFRNTFDTRLVYLGSVLTLLAVAELCAPYRPGPTALAALGIVFVFSMCANVAELGDSAKRLRLDSAVNKAKLTAIKDAGSAAAPGALVERPPQDMTFDVVTLRELEDEVGTPAYSEAELGSATAAAREAADRELVRVLRIAPRSAPNIAPPSGARFLSVEVEVGQPTSWHGSCVSILPRHGTAAKAVIRFRSGGLAYSSPAPVEVSLGRFADGPTVPLPPRPGPTRIAVAAPVGEVPWTAALSVSAPTRVCPAGR